MRAGDSFGKQIKTRSNSDSKVLLVFKFTLKGNIFKTYLSV